MCFLQWILLLYKLPNSIAFHLTLSLLLMGIQTSPKWTNDLNKLLMVNVFVIRTINTHYVVSIRSCIESLTLDHSQEEAF